MEYLFPPPVYHFHKTSASILHSLGRYARLYDRLLPLPLAGRWLVKKAAFTLINEPTAFWNMRSPFLFMIDIFRESFRTSRLYSRRVFAPHCIHTRRKFQLSPFFPALSTFNPPVFS